MPSRRLAVAALPAFLLLAVPAAAQQVYQWTDADGVSHYSGTPPDGIDYQSRQVSSRDQVVQVQEQEAEAPVEDPECRTARENLGLLDGDAPLQIDSDGDGTPDKTLAESDREQARALAEAALVRCASPAPAAGTSGS